MSRNIKKKRRESPKRWLPFIAAGFFGLHMIVFLLLAQCTALAPGYEDKVSYIKVREFPQELQELQLERPPERMFYQYATMPLSQEEEEPKPLMAPYWDGYQTLAALKVEDYETIENYRLTLRKKEEFEFAPRSPQYQPVFQTVFIRGVPVQPVSRIPEPGTSILMGLSFLWIGSLRRRH